MSRTRILQDGRWCDKIVESNTHCPQCRRELVCAVARGCTQGEQNTKVLECLDCGCRWIEE